MDNTKLYDMVERYYLYKWQEEIEKDKDCLFANETKELRASLKSELNETAAEIFRRYDYTLRNYNEYVQLMLGIRLLNLGIELGMSLKDGFSENDDSH